MKISYQNKIDDLTLVASSSETDFPIENVQQEHLAFSWRTTTVSSANVVADAGTGLTIDPDSAFIAGVNLSDTAVVKIQGNATDVWTSPSVDITMSRNEDVFYSYSELFAAFRYWRFVIEDPSNADGYLEVGRMWIGDVTEAQGPHINFVEVRNNTSDITISITGQAYGDLNYIFKSWEMSYPYWDEIEKANIEIFADYVNKVRPFFVQFVDNNGCKLGPFYVIMTNSMEFTHLKTLDIWSSVIAFREVF